MDQDALATLQAPLKASYRDDPDAALVTLRAGGSLVFTMGSAPSSWGR